MKLDSGWNLIVINLSDFVKKAYGTSYASTEQIQIHANCRIRRIYFSDRLYSDEELPTEFKLFLNTRSRWRSSLEGKNVFQCRFSQWPPNYLIDASIFNSMTDIEHPLSTLGKSVKTKAYVICECGRYLLSSSTFMLQKAVAALKHFESSNYNSVARRTNFFEYWKTGFEFTP